MEKYNSRNEVPEDYKWDLTDFFKDEKEYNSEFKIAEKLVNELEKYKGCTKNSEKLYEFITKNLETETLIVNLYVYAALINDQELGKSQSISRLNKIENLYSNLISTISFFEPELLTLDKKEYEKLFENKKLEEFKFMLDLIYRDKEHILSENEEKIINELNNAMNNFENMSSEMLNSEHDYGTINIDGKEEQIRQTNLRRFLKNKDENIRKEVYNKFKKVLNQYSVSSASFLNSYVKSNNTEAKLRHFKSAWDAKLFSYNMKQKAYDALVSSVEDNVNVLQKYYKLIKKQLGLKKLHQYDLDLDITNLDKKYSIEDSIKIIRESLQPLGDEYLKCFDKIIDNHYIDFCEYKGKCSGGYSASTGDHDSRILMSFNEDLTSVSTIIHECGHNIHHQFVKKNNKIQYRDVAIILAEVASLTNECLLSNYLINNGKTKEEKLSGIENLLRTISSNLFGAVREAKMENDFNEYSLNDNTLTNEYLNELTLNSYKKYYGKEVELNEYSGLSWITRTHYYNNYYLYDYAFCISVAIYVSNKILNNEEDMLNKYIKFLSTGSDLWPKDVFKILGIDLEDKKVYEEAIKYFEELINKYEEISKS